MFPLKEMVGTTVPVPEQGGRGVVVEVHRPSWAGALRSRASKAGESAEGRRKRVGEAGSDQRRTGSQRNGWSQRRDRDANRCGRIRLEGRISGVGCSDGVATSAQRRALSEDVVIDAGAAGNRSGHKISVAVGIQRRRRIGIAVHRDGHRAGGNANSIPELPVTWT